MTAEMSNMSTLGYIFWSCSSKKQGKSHTGEALCMHTHYPRVWKLWFPFRVWAAPSASEEWNMSAHETNWSRDPFTNACTDKSCRIESCLHLRSFVPSVQKVLMICVLSRSETSRNWWRKRITKQATSRRCSQWGGNFSTNIIPTPQWNFLWL